MRSFRGASKKFRARLEAEYIYPLGWYKRLPNGYLQDELGIIYEIVSSGLHWRYVRHPLQDAESVDEYEFPDVDSEERARAPEYQTKLYYRSD